MYICVCVCVYSGLKQLYNNSIFLVHSYFYCGDRFLFIFFTNAYLNYHYIWDKYSTSVNILITENPWLAVRL